ncbi:MAG TPA: molybdopterin molybdotransferase MoeA, partial [Acidimicrobiia bacterium]
MRTLESARSEVLSSVELLDSEQVPIWEADGRILADDVFAPDDVPPFPNSAMDGFAVRSLDVGSPGSILEVLGDLPAGTVTEVEIGPGEALKIMTGAPMPAGADTVVKVEDTTSDGSKVVINTAVEAGTSVRPAGGDVVRGQLVFAKGTRLTPMHVGVLATIGLAHPEVAQRPKVAFMSTGDELAPPETAQLGPGAIRDSNRPMLKALLEETGVDLIDLGTVPDDPRLLRGALEQGSTADFLVSTGGVSMG